MLLDISEVSYNNEKSNHSKKTQKKTGFSSDSDYSYNSDRRNGKKKKSKKKESRKSLKSKKSKKTCKTKTTEKKNITLPALPLDLSEENNVNEIEKVRKTLSPINAKNLNSVSLKRHCETSQIEKHFKRNESQSTSVFNNVLSHDYSLYQNNDSNLLKPLTYQFNSDTKTSPLLRPSTINLIPITTGHNYLITEESTLEPIRMKNDEENHIAEGNISVFFYYLFNLLLIYLKTLS